MAMKMLRRAGTVKRKYQFAVILHELRIEAAATGEIMVLWVRGARTARSVSTKGRLGMFEWGVEEQQKKPMAMLCTLYDQGGKATGSGGKRTAPGRGRAVAAGGGARDSRPGGANMGGAAPLKKREGALDLQPKKAQLVIKRFKGKNLQTVGFINLDLAEYAGEESMSRLVTVPLEKSTVKAQLTFTIHSRSMSARNMTSKTTKNKHSMPAGGVTQAEDDVEVSRISVAESYIDPDEQAEFSDEEGTTRNKRNSTSTGSVPAGYAGAGAGPPGSSSRMRGMGGPRGSTRLDRAPPPPATKSTGQGPTTTTTIGSSRATGASGEHQSPPAYTAETTDMSTLGTVKRTKADIDEPANTSGITTAEGVMRRQEEAVAAIAARKREVVNRAQLEERERDEAARRESEAVQPQPPSLPPPPTPAEAEAILAAQAKVEEDPVLIEAEKAIAMAQKQLMEQREDAERRRKRKAEKKEEKRRRKAARQAERVRKARIEAGLAPFAEIADAPSVKEGDSKLFEESDRAAEPSKVTTTAGGEPQVPRVELDEALDQIQHLEAQLEETRLQHGVPESMMTEMKMLRQDAANGIKDREMYLEMRKANSRAEALLLDLHKQLKDAAQANDDLATQLAAKTERVVSLDISLGDKTREADASDRAAKMLRTELETLKAENAQLRSRRVHFDQISTAQGKKNPKKEAEAVSLLQEQVVYYENQLKNSDATLAAAQQAWSASGGGLMREVQSLEASLAKTRDLLSEALEGRQTNQVHEQVQLRKLKLALHDRMRLSEAVNDLELKVQRRELELVAANEFSADLQRQLEEAKDAAGSRQ